MKHLLSLVLLPVALVVASCSVTSESSYSGAPYFPQDVEGREQGSEIKKNFDRSVRVWSFSDGREYKDRNGDGVVDWMRRGDTEDNDGFCQYKEDNDYDGFYDRAYRAGGYAYRVVSQDKIHEPVEDIHRVYPPTRFIRSE